MCDKGIQCITNAFIITTCDLIDGQVQAFQHKQSTGWPSQFLYAGKKTNCISLYIKVFLKRKKNLLVSLYAWFFLILLFPTTSNNRGWLLSTQWPNTYLDLILGPGHQYSVVKVITNSNSPGHHWYSYKSSPWTTILSTHIADLNKNSLVVSDWILTTSQHTSQTWTRTVW